VFDGQITSTIHVAYFNESASKAPFEHLYSSHNDNIGLNETHKKHMHMAEKKKKSSAVAEIGDRGHNRHGRKEGGGCCAPFADSWDHI